MSDLHLLVVSQQGKILDGQFESLTVPTMDGLITILPKHTPIFSVLKSGEVVAKNGDSTQHFAVTGGFVSVHKDMVKLLVDFGIESSKIQETVVLEAKKRAEEQIAKGADNDPATIDARAELVRAIVQLQVVQRRKRN
jgi:F-type H+-transporting ATPase subunit epsilon